MSEEPSDDLNTCPLCCNKMTGQDELLFFPCTCNYQVCAFCFDKVKGGQCPHCRTVYDPKVYRRLTPEEFMRQFPDKRLPQSKPRSRPVKSHRQSTLLSSSHSHINKSELSKTRVLQSNLVYVTGVPNSLTVDELKSSSFFGKYGTVLKIVAKHNAHIEAHRHTYALYITYSTDESAKDCILSSTETYLGGNLLRCSFGTTKFCTSFLDGKQCANKDCMFLHDLRDDHIIFTEKDTNNKRRFNEYVHPKVPQNRITFIDNPGQIAGLPPSWDKEQSKNQSGEMDGSRVQGTPTPYWKIAPGKGLDLKQKLELLHPYEIEEYTTKLAGLTFPDTPLFFPLPPCR
ncbi:Transcriptional repressor [Giardia duodenalis]|uniref:Transcriptional repressor n=1 Tax=Giardia intestinalis TaxID=5741 RepID=V6TN48_GIAIN|nr:Transcriptional repressor [Giardia intestinalis]